MAQKSVEAPYGLHWFRRDLRLQGNSILQKSLKKHQGRVLCVFCFDRKFLSRPDFSAHRFLFFLKTLKALQEEIQERGGDLIFMDEGPSDSFPKLFKKLKSEFNSLPGLVTWNRDYEPFAMGRDERMSQWFQDQGVNYENERDHLFFEPNEVLKPDRNSPYYQVFTPYYKKWLDLFKSRTGQERLGEILSGLKQKPHLFALKPPRSLNSDSIFEHYLKSTEKRVQIPVPQVGFQRAFQQAKYFIDKKIEGYETQRDVPSLAGTSQMSIYFKNGSFTVPQMIALLASQKSPQAQKLSEKYQSELVWREFYYQILAHFPYVEHSAFQKRYENIEWENNEEWFEKWKAGETGFPIVDAGMRQLNQTGWMHNRVRMIVASFLTKDLLIDYRWGERYFMEKLLDGDLAPNNGGWQWAASTGCDAQPYFRIFNPTLQAERFDPKGEYIRKWAPHSHSFKPVVDHSAQKSKAVALFAKWKSS